MLVNYTKASLNGYAFVMVQLKADAFRKILKNSCEMAGPDTRTR